MRKAELPTYNNIEGRGAYTVEACIRTCGLDGIFLLRFDDDNQLGVYEGSPEDGWFGGWGREYYDGPDHEKNDEAVRDFFYGYIEYRTGQMIDCTEVEQ